MLRPLTYEFQCIHCLSLVHNVATLSYMGPFFFRICSVAKWHLQMNLWASKAGVYGTLLFTDLVCHLKNAAVFLDDETLDCKLYVVPFTLAFTSSLRVLLFTLYATKFVFQYIQPHQPLLPRAAPTNAVFCYGARPPGLLAERSYSSVDYLRPCNVIL